MMLDLGRSHARSWLSRNSCAVPRGKGNTHNWLRLNPGVDGGTFLVVEEKFDEFVSALTMDAAEGNLIDFVELKCKPGCSDRYTLFCDLDFKADNNDDDDTPVITEEFISRYMSVVQAVVNNIFTEEDCSFIVSWAGVKVVTTKEKRPDAERGSVYIEITKVKWGVHLYWPHVTVNMEQAQFVWEACLDALEREIPEAEMPKGSPEHMKILDGIMCDKTGLRPCFNMKKGMDSRDDVYFVRRAFKADMTPDPEELRLLESDPGHVLRRTLLTRYGAPEALPRGFDEWKAAGGPQRQKNGKKRKRGKAGQAGTSGDKRRGKQRKKGHTGVTEAAADVLLKHIADNVESFRGLEDHVTVTPMDAGTLKIHGDAMRYCHNVQREHVSNHTYYIVGRAFQEARFEVVQRCYDEDCVDYHKVVCARIPERVAKACALLTAGVAQEGGGAEASTSGGGVEQGGTGAGDGDASSVIPGTDTVLSFSLIRFISRLDGHYGKGPIY